MTNEEVARVFNETRPFIQGKQDLRDPQVERWFRQPLLTGMWSAERVGKRIFEDKLT